MKAHKISVSVSLPIYRRTVEPLFMVPRFKVFCHLTFTINDPKSIESVLNCLHLRFAPVSCSNPLLLNMHIPIHLELQLSEIYT